MLKTTLNISLGMRYVFIMRIYIHRGIVEVISVATQIQVEVALCISAQLQVRVAISNNCQNYSKREVGAYTFEIAR